MSIDRDVAALRERMHELAALSGAKDLLVWDQMTYMPPGGARTRGAHGAVIGRLLHERMVEPGLRRLLERLRASGEALDPLVRDEVTVLLRDVELAARYPSALVAEVAAHGSACFDAWRVARERDDFGVVAALLERSLDLTHRLAACHPDAAHPADPFIDAADEGMSVALLVPLFTELRDALVPMVEAVAERGEPRAVLPVRGAGDAQLALALRLAVDLGYDLERGRQDVAPHPFAIRIGHGDVRITSRVDAADLQEALFSTIHEAGHALYEQGLADALDGTALASGVSAGVHESQSRLYENLVGRSRAFWRYALPHVQTAFPELAHLDVEAAYRAVNRVRRSLIRTDADELTYNLHVIVRFDLELDLLAGNLSVAELPEAWAERYRRDLGVVPNGAADGVLQDLHWFGGAIPGHFQGYTIGNVLSVAFFDAARAALGDLDAQVAAGEFAPLRAWLREHVHAHGRRYRPLELAERVTGRPFRVEPYLAYLRAKYLDDAAPMAAVA
jgi:carboxypeptidase Taq